MRFGEMHFRNPWHKDFSYFLKKNVGDLRDDDNVVKMVGLLFSGRRFDGLRGNYWQQIQKVLPETLSSRLVQTILDSDRSLGAVFRALVIECTRIRGYNRCLIKFPVYPLYVDFLVDYFPNARILHITRDPRATAASKTSDPGGAVHWNSAYPWAKGLLPYAMKLFVVIQYIMVSRIHNRMVNNPQYRLFHYEDLLYDPEGSIHSMCDYLAIRYMDSFLNPKAGQPSSITGEIRNGFDVASAARWRSRLSARETSLITWMTRRAMLRVGFDPETHPVYRDVKG